MGKEYRKTWLSYFAEDKRYAAMTGLGFSSGLPFLLAYLTQSAWLSEVGVPIETIGLLSDSCFNAARVTAFLPFVSGSSKSVDGRRRVPEEPSIDSPEARS